MTDQNKPGQDKEHIDNKPGQSNKNPNDRDNRDNRDGKDGQLEKGRQDQTKDSNSRRTE